MAKGEAEGATGNQHTLTIGEAKRLAAVFFTARMPFMLVGAPGLGKTDCIKQSAENAGMDLIISHPVVSDPTDYKGMPWVMVAEEEVNGETVERNVAEFLPFSDLERIIKPARPTVFFLDDLGQAPPSVQAACMQLILARRINEHVVSDEVTFVAATNRRQDQAGVSGILEPVKSRFASILHLAADSEEWLDWASTAGMPAVLRAFIRWRPALIHDFKPTKDMTNTPSPRTVAAVGRILLSGCPTELLEPAIAGAAGDGFANEFMSYITLIKDMPDVDADIANPDKAVIPSEPAMLYAYCTAIADRAAKKAKDTSDKNRKTCENIVRLSMRIGDEASGEYAVLLIKDALQQNREGIKKNRAFLEWATKYNKLFM